MKYIRTSKTHMDIEIEVHDEGYEALYACAATNSVDEEAGKIIKGYLFDGELKEFARQNYDMESGVCSIDAEIKIMPDGKLYLSVDVLGSDEIEISKIEKLYAIIHFFYENKDIDWAIDALKDLDDAKKALDDLYDDEKIDDEDYTLQLLGACCKVLVQSALYEDPTEEYLKFKEATGHLVTKITQDIGVDLNGRPVLGKEQNEKKTELYVFKKLDVLIEASAFCEDGEVYKDKDSYILFTDKRPELLEMSEEIISANEDTIARIKEMDTHLCSVSDLKEIA